MATIEGGWFPPSAMQYGASAGALIYGTECAWPRRRQIPVEARYELTLDADSRTMNAERWRTIEQLYGVAVELEPGARDSFLAHQCREDSDLRREVESLLAQSGSSGALVDRSAWADAGFSAGIRREWSPGECLGPYKVLKLLRQGGMGAVCEAIDTRLDRKVAIKFCNERFSGRFEREVRAISALNHPNICTLYDAGPDYLVMELVEG